MAEAEQQDFDVVIMGAGFAGICQARHLLLNVPGIRVALIDPKTQEGSEADFKVGESTVEISAMFLYKELGLYEYLIDNHPPKYGLNFHWPKRGDRTESLDDYHHIWTNRQPELPSFQINRSRFERDVLKMVCDQGASFFHGKVADFAIGEGAARHSIEVKLVDGGMASLSCEHLVDAAGRKFLIGRKTDNLTTDEEETCGLRTGSAWLRVENVDRELFHDGYDPFNGVASHYYGTNHFFGKGHWIWMIPIERETRTVSFGVVHHFSEIDSESLRTREKFLNFVGANHALVKKLIDSGDIADFKYLPRLTHLSKTMMSKDRWYVVGDAANMLDPFYSAGLVIAAITITGVTDAIRAQREEGEEAYEMKRALHNDFNLFFGRVYAEIYRDHDKHLGNASAMSWRVYLENTVWIRLLVPMFVGHWHLDRGFIRSFQIFSKLMVRSERSVFRYFYREFSRVAERGTNIGMMDYARADQLCLGFAPTDFGDGFLQNALYEPRRLNVLKGMRTTFFFLSLLYLKLMWRSRGILGLLKPSTAWLVTKLWAMSAFTSCGAVAHWVSNLGRPTNSDHCAARREFDATYRGTPELVPWTGLSGASASDFTDETGDEEAAADQLFADATAGTRALAASSIAGERD